MVSKELRFVVYCVGLYVSFMLWAFLQERITSTKYELGDNEQAMWKYPVALNLAMAVATFLTASVIEIIWGENVKVPVSVFWKPALSATLASPIGYEALKYINYPLMILTKSSKPVPVMAIGVFFYGRVYGWYKYASVALLCGGIYLFTLGKKSDSQSQGVGNIKLILFGMMLVLVNLAMDGYTNNDQDRIFVKHSASPNQMMKYTNLWQCLYQFIFLAVGYVLQAERSALYVAMRMCMLSSALVMDILLFCVCASVGQVLIFNVIKEFGSLSWITISVTRKLFTVVLSVIVFQHKVNPMQWFGVALVFIGLALDAVMSYRNSPKGKSSVKDGKKQEKGEKSD